MLTSTVIPVFTARGPDHAELEESVIQSAYNRNDELKNIQHATKHTWGIKGVVRGGKGKAPANAGQFRLMMRL